LRKRSEGQLSPAQPTFAVPTEQAARQPLAWPDPAVAHCELTTSRRMCRVYDFLIAELRR